MEFSTYVRKPFTVEAVLLTEENIAEAAELIGTLRKDRNDKPFIRVNPHWVPNLERVWPGYYMTRLDHAIRCYHPKAFADQFSEITPEIKDWITFLNGDQEEAVGG